MPTFPFTIYCMYKEDQVPNLLGGIKKTRLYDDITFTFYKL